MNNSLLVDLNSFSKFNEIFLTGNARHFCKNANKYAHRCECFIQDEHEVLFPKRHRTCSLNIVRTYGYFVQTEFQQIILWGSRSFSKTAVGDDVFGHISSRMEDLEALIKILSNKIQSS